MSRIRVLPEILANKIAAGEIVERPASVVKELVENSIDAGASTINVEVESGGKKLMQVVDDGEGMTRDDAILAFEHHATSKIQSVADLGAIATLGFRGEALPSIASISRLTLRTRHESDPGASGSEILIQGGTLRSVKPIAWEKGTEVSVRDLFFNVPARRKFLRSHSTELGHITRLLTHYALAHPQIRFVLRSDGRSLIDVLATRTLNERVYQLFGDEYLKNLVEISGRSAAVHVHGLCSLPHEQRTNPYSQFFYVNRRMVRDKVIASAVRQAYRNVIPASSYPVVLLFLELPFEEVDVNAHPAKIEVRFRQQGLVHDLIRDTLDRSITGGRSIPPYEHGSDAWMGRFGGPPSAGQSQMDTVYPKGSPPSFRYGAQDGFQAAFAYPFQGPTEPGTSGPPKDHGAMRVRPDLLLREGVEARESPLLPGGVRILGQIHESYIVASDREGLLVIDQHVAHERILYERNALALRGSSVDTQGLLVPITLELPPHQAALADRVLPELNRNGFGVERFGGRTLLVRSVPAVAKDYDSHKLLAEILEGLEAEERTLDVERIRDRIAVSMACRGAIKVHTPLTLEKMQWLIEELGQTKIPTNCPHGRPVILRFSLYEIERNFGRV